MLTEKQIFIEASGVDEEGTPKSLVQLATKFFDVNEGDEEKVREMTFDGAVVNIFRSLRMTMIDLKFESAVDYGFIQASEMLKEFTTAENSTDEETGRMPIVQLTIMPKELEGQYYICGIHGSWCLMPSEPGKAADIIRFIFDNDTVHSFEINETELDVDDIEYKAARNEQFGISVDED